MCILLSSTVSIGVGRVSFLPSGWVSGFFLGSPSSQRNIGSGQTFFIYSHFWPKIWRKMYKISDNSHEFLTSGHSGFSKFTTGPRVGAGSQKNCSGRVGLAKNISGRVLTRPINRFKILWSLLMQMVWYRIISHMCAKIHQCFPTSKIVPKCMNIFSQKWAL